MTGGFAVPGPGGLTRQSHVLILENSRAQRTFLSMLLRKWGHDVTVCERPAEALDILAHRDITEDEVLAEFLI